MDLSYWENGVFSFEVIDKNSNISDINFYIERGNPRKCERERVDCFNALVVAAQTNDIQLIRCLFELVAV